MSDEKIIFEAWLELAQGYREVVIAAFVLPILFLRQIIGLEEGKSVVPHINLFFIISWLCLTVSVASGILYENAATCIILQGETNKTGLACNLPAWFLYISYMGLFVAGLIFFGLGALLSVIRREKNGT